MDMKYFKFYPDDVILFFISADRYNILVDTGKVTSYKKLKLNIASLNLKESEN